MLLKQLLLQASASPNLLFRDPFAAIESEQLVQEVIGLANIDFSGDRYLIFGVNVGAVEGSGIVGIKEDAMADLKTAHRMISSLVKPLVYTSRLFSTRLKASWWARWKSMVAKTLPSSCAGITPKN